MTLPIFSKTDCVFSEDRRHRHILTRSWMPDENTKFPRDLVVFVGLNPSTADETKLDNTVTRCVKFAASWGYCQMVMANLFPYRATHPLDMKKAADPTDGGGWHNSVQNVLRISREIVLCWGNHGKYLNRSSNFLDLVTTLGLRSKCRVFYLTGYKEPVHPLYLPSRLPVRPLWTDDGAMIENPCPSRLIVNPPKKAKVKAAREKRAAPRMPVSFVYVIENKGLSVTDNVVVKKYPLLQKSKKGNSIKVAVRGRIETINRKARNRVIRCHFFFNDTSLVNYLRTWLKNQHAELTKQESFNLKLRSLPDAELIVTLTQTTTA